MKENPSLNKLAPLLKKNYGIDAYFVETNGNIHKIYSNKGGFILKKIDPHHGIDFIKYVQTLYQKGFNRIVPIYPAVDGRYAVLHNGDLYYLMPWLPDEEKEERTERQKKLFRELARLHTISVKEIPFKKEDRTEHFEKTILEIEQEEEFLLDVLETCERKIYMSPFELQFCTYYHDMYQALQFSKKKLEEWYEATKELEKVRVAVIHGKLSNDHFVYNEKGYGYFINFENAHIGVPSHDLLPYLANSLRGFPKQSEEIVENIYLYFKFFPLKEDEMALFLSYFSHPFLIIKTAERLFQEGKNRNERKAVQKLQRDYWQLKNTEYIIMRIDEIERQRKLEEAARKEN